MPIVFDTLGEDAFGVPKSAVSRAALYILLALAAAYIGSSSEARARLGAARWRLMLVSAFGVAAALSTMLAVDRSVALFGAHRRYLGLTSIIDGIVLTVAIQLFVVRQRDLIAVIGGLFTGASIVIAYGALQVARLDPVQWSQSAFASTVGNRGVLAGYLVIMASGAVALALGGRQWLGRSSRYALLGVGTASALLVLATGARGPRLALLVSLLFAGYSGALVSNFVGWRPHGRLVAAVLLAGGSLVATAEFVHPTLRTLFTAEDTSVAERSFAYATAVSIISAFPLFGAGPDHFAVLFPTHHPVPPDDVAAAFAPSQTSAHSWVLHNLVGTGVVGLAALLTIITLSLVRALRLARAGVASASLGAAGLVAFVAQGIFNISDVVTETMFWTAVGMCLTQPVRADGQLVRPATIQKLARRLVLPAVVGLALATTTLNWVHANRDLRASDLFRAAGRYELAERSALQATLRDPGRANNWNVLGLALSARDARAALNAFERASAAAPYEPRYLINVVKEQARLADTESSRLDRLLRDAKRAVELAPRNPETHQVLSYALAKVGDVTGAKREAELAIRLAPRNPAFYSWSAAIHQDVGDFRTAVSRYQTYADMTSAAGSLSDETRRRLSTLYGLAGDHERELQMLRPPRVIGADRGCIARAGSAPTSAGVERPLCIRVWFESEIDLRTGQAADGVLFLGNYLVDGRALPADAVLEWDGRALAIHLPAAPTAPAPGARLTIRGIANVKGMGIVPDPTEVTLP